MLVTTGTPPYLSKRVIAYFKVLGADRGGDPSKSVTNHFYFNLLIVKWTAIVCGGGKIQPTVAVARCT
jgi:hypothetical protein